MMSQSRGDTFFGLAVFENPQIWNFSAAIVSELQVFPVSAAISCCRSLLESPRALSSSSLASKPSVRRWNFDDILSGIKGVFPVLINTLPFPVVDSLDCSRNHLGTLSLSSPWSILPSLLLQKYIFIDFFSNLTLCLPKVQYACIKKSIQALPIKTVGEIIKSFGSRALSFSDPYFHFTFLSVLLSFCHSVILCVRKFRDKYLGNEAR